MRMLNAGSKNIFGNVSVTTLFEKEVEVILKHDLEKWNIHFLRTSEAGF